ncbi:MAG TPA: alpha,alpha-trehalase TreF [Steroidobacteraceae bacterium]|jgi:alpha,alpha-trehalase|nr:alpha,alpha-trehalase TreF [Steroidobacteraceae bacterium]
MNGPHAVHGFGVAPALLASVLLAAALPVAATQPETTPLQAYPDPPQVLFKDLFVAVQMAAIYQDGKAFADAAPDAAPGEILAQYHAARPDSREALKRFVEAHFSLPGQASSAASPPEQIGIVAHIDGLWDTLSRSTTAAAPYSSLLPLPQPYVVPGGRFREIYYWDSYFTMLGLDESGRHDLVADMVRDFAYLIDTYGHVPNGTRTYYLSRSQPPFFFAMVGLLSSDDPAGAFAQYLPELRREYAFWMQGASGLHHGTAHRRVVAMPDGSILNRYWDDRDTPRDESYREDIELAHASERPASQLFRDIRAAAESGWDFGSRWFADARTRVTIDTTEIVPIDLNSLLFGLETAIRLGCQRRADHVCAAEFARHAAARRAAIDRYLWGSSAGAYLDYRWTQHVSITRVSAAMLYPLFVGLASESQATVVASTTRRDLLKSGGIVTTALDTGQQWDAPNGWAPIQWIAISGLRQYGQNSLAEAIACRWMINVNNLYGQSGKLVEKYDVITVGRGGRGGEYPTQDGFGWTNGVMRKLIALYPADAADTASAQCP